MRGNIQHNDGNTDTQRTAERSLMEIKGAELMDMAGKARPERGHHARDKEDKNCGKGVTQTKPPRRRGWLGEQPQAAGTMQYRRQRMLPHPRVATNLDIANG